MYQIGDTSLVPTRPPSALSTLRSTPSGQQVGDASLAPFPNSFLTRGSRLVAGHHARPHVGHADIPGGITAQQALGFEPGFIGDGDPPPGVGRCVALKARIRHDIGSQAPHQGQQHRR